MLEFLIKKFSKTNTFVLSFPQTSICLKSIVDFIYINLSLNFYVSFVVRIDFYILLECSAVQRNPVAHGGRDGLRGLRQASG